MHFTNSHRNLKLSLFIICVETKLQKTAIKPSARWGEKVKWYFIDADAGMGRG